MGLGHSPRIVTENLVLALDAGNPKNYNAGISTNWTDKVGGNNGTLVGGTHHNDGPFVGAGYVEFDGTGDYLTPASSSDFAFGTGDFTIEYWINTSASADDGILQISTTAGGFATSYTNGLMMSLYNGTFYYALGGSSVNTGTTLNNGNWRHITMCRSGSSLKIFVDGDSIVSTTNTTDVTATNLVIGGYYSTSYTLSGNISNLRILKGTALYTSDFTPPTKPLTAVPNTVLLTCQGNSISPGTDIVVTTSNKGSGSVGSLSAVTSSGNYYFDNRSASPSTASIQLDFKTVQTGVTQIKLSGGSYALGSTFDLYVNGVLVEDDRSVVSAWGEDTITISSTNISSIKIEGSDGYSLGALKFNGTLVSGTIAEIVPNGNAAARLGFPASAFEFDGTNDYVDCGTSSNYTFGAGAFTAEMWIYPTATPSQFDCILIGDNPNLTSVFWGYRSGYLDFVNRGDTYTLLRMTYPSLNQWSHVVISRDSSGYIAAYKNGILQASASGNTDSYNQTEFYVGGQSSFVYPGYISNVRIYKGKGLTATEVQQNYNALKGRYV